MLIFCDLCTTSFICMTHFEDVKQAENCASFSDDGKIYCHYGSSFDTWVFYYKPTLIKDDLIICDFCLIEMIRLNEIKLIADYVTGELTEECRIHFEMGVAIGKWSW